MEVWHDYPWAHWSRASGHLENRGPKLKLEDFVKPNCLKSSQVKASW